MIARLTNQRHYWVKLVTENECMGSEVVVVVVVVVGRMVGEHVQSLGQYSVNERMKVVSWGPRVRGE